MKSGVSTPHPGGTIKEQDKVHNHAQTGPLLPVAHHISMQGTSGGTLDRTGKMRCLRLPPHKEEECLRYFTAKKQGKPPMGEGDCKYLLWNPSSGCQVGSKAFMAQTIKK